MPEGREAVVDLAACRLARHPELGIDSPQIEGDRMAAQRLASVLVAVFVEIRHRQLAQASVHRIAKAQHGAVGLGNRAPRAAATEQRDDVRVIAGRAVHMHHEWPLAVDPERARGDECAFDAMRAALTQHFAYRKDRLSAELMVGWDRIYELLDPRRLGQPADDPQVAPPQTQNHASRATKRADPRA